MGSYNEPWHTGPDSKKGHPALFDSEGTYLASIDGNAADAKAIAGRVVDTVNACAEFETNLDDSFSQYTFERLFSRERRLRAALEAIRDQDEPQHPTGTWARDEARRALADALGGASDG